MHLCSLSAAHACSYQNSTATTPNQTPTKTLLLANCSPTARSYTLSSAPYSENQHSSMKRTLLWSARHHSSWLQLGQGLSVWSLRVLPVLVWVSYRTLPHCQKHIHIGKFSFQRPWTQHWLRAEVGPQLPYIGCPLLLMDRVNAKNWFHYILLSLNVCGK